MALNNENLKTIKSLNYIPVGLKNENFSNDWLRDNTKDNISKKNPYFNIKKKMNGQVFALTENIGALKMQKIQIKLMIQF